MKKSYCSFHGLKFKICSELYTIADIDADYDLSDLRSSDIVLDVGAAVGGFSLLAAQKTTHVYAVEPLFADTLRENIKTNNISNITVLECGIGLDKKSTIRFSNSCEECDMMPFPDVLAMVGPCDFLKMDCEGCEHSLNAGDLRGFRRIEAELHIREGDRDFNALAAHILGDEFEYTLIPRTKDTQLLHAKRTRK